MKQFKEATITPRIWSQCFKHCKQEATWLIPASMAIVRWLQVSFTASTQQTKMQWGKPLPQNFLTHASISSVRMQGHGITTDGW